MKTSAWVAFSPLLLVVGVWPLAGQTPPVISLQKSVVAEQTEPDVATVRGYALVGVVAFTSATSGVTVNMVGPSGSADRFSQMSSSQYGGGRDFVLRSEFDAQYPDGVYAVQLSGARTGSYAVNVGGTLPEAPVITNYAAAQCIRNGRSFTLTWAPLTSGTAQDYVYLQITNESGAVVFDSGGMGAPFALNGLSRQATFTLAADQKFKGKLNHLKYSQGLPISATAPYFGGTLAETQFTLRTTAASAAPVLDSLPRSQHVAPGAAVTFSVAATADAAITYQWSCNGAPIAGATNATYDLANAQTANMGFYSVAATAGGATTASGGAVLTVETGGSARPVNISSRAYVPAGGDLAPGFVIAGTGAKTVLVRAVGPGLTPFGVPGVLADPQLEVIAQGGATVAANDDWSLAGTAQVAAISAASAAVGAFPLPAGSHDAAVVVALAPGAYTARVTGGAGGVVLVEVYDTEPGNAASRLINVSTRAFVGTGANKLVTGFVVSGPASRQLLIRAIGPGLAAFGVTGRLADPQLAVVPLGLSTVIGRSDNWGAALATIFTQAGAFALPNGSQDAATVLRLPPGGYTVEVSGVGDATGQGLVEVYDLGP